MSDPLPSISGGLPLHWTRMMMGKHFRTRNVGTIKFQPLVTDSGMAQAGDKTGEPNFLPINSV